MQAEVAPGGPSGGAPAGAPPEPDLGGARAREGPESGRAGGAPAGPPPLRRSLERVLWAALEDFPEPAHDRQIRDYVAELSHLMTVAGEGESESSDSSRAHATCEATGDDEVTLLCKLEDYLESILIERISSRVGR